MNQLWTPSIVLVILTISLGVALLVSVILAWTASIRERKERERGWRR